MSNSTFRLAFIRNKIRDTLQSAFLKTALLSELSTSSPDAELVMKMVEKVQPIRTAAIQPQPMQPVQPVPIQGQQVAM